MTIKLRIAQWGMLLGLAALMSACVVEPHEGYYDRDHARYYHQHAWHQCGPGDNFCK